MSQENSNRTDAQPIRPEPEAEPITIEPEEEEPISLVESAESMIKPKAVRTFGAGTSPLGEKKAEFKRPMNITGKGATRCRVFHSKIATAPLEHLQDNINEWMDADEIEIKHVGQVIGIMDEKRKEPNLLVLVWY